jgi:cytochrome P450
MKFDPARFAKKPRRGTFVPFSGGPRRCLGQHYARMSYVL